MSDVKIQKVESEEDRSLPVFAEFEDVMDRIRRRAFELFRHDNSAEDRKLEHWLTAERELCWPASQLREDDDEYEFKVALAGFDEDDISLTASPHELMVKAKHESKRESDGDDKVRWSHFTGDSVYRRVELPQAIDVSKVDAKLKNGMLKIEAQKVKPGKDTESRAKNTGSTAKKNQERKVDVSSAA